MSFWALQQNPGVFAHGMTVHGVYINYRHEGRRDVESYNPVSKKRGGQNDADETSDADEAKRKPRKVSEVRKGRAVRYGHAMLFLKGMVFRRWRGFVVQRNLNPALRTPPKSPPPALLPPGQEQQHGQQRMDDDRAPKRPHETPVRAQREPKSPGGTTYAALVLAGLGSSSTESTPAARPAKSRSTGSSSASERSGQG